MKIILGLVAIIIGAFLFVSYILSLPVKSWRIGCMRVVSLNRQWFDSTNWRQLLQDDTSIVK